MKLQKTLSITVVILCAMTNFGASAEPAKDAFGKLPQLKQPWISLFNGENLDGWTQVGEVGAEAKNGEIICHMKANTLKHSYVCTSEEYSDFILEMDVLTDETFSSGIVLRGKEKPPDCDTCANLYGYQIKIDPTERSWTGGIYETFGTGFHWYYTLENDERARNAYKLGEWNHIRVEAIGKQIKVWINDIPTANMLHSKYEKGSIALKIHSLKNNNPEKEKSFGRFKNIRILSKNPETYVKPMDLPAVEVQ